VSLAPPPGELQGQVAFVTGAAGGVAGDVTSELAVRAAYYAAVRRFGGVDIVVSNAGIASSAPIEETKNAAAYSSAKALELHLARCLAEEGGAIGLRVNTINPDAVLQGSRIVDGGVPAAYSR
jgi:NAD(P)-dependent dehydrogenase (short-subunit alcohol dehydrogenase family)